MKKALIPVLAIAAASVAVPAAAQNYDRHDRNDRYERNDRDRYENHGRWQSIAQRKYQLDRRIDVGMRNGSLSRREAVRLQSELNSLIRLERNYMRGGLTRWERNDLDRRYDRLAVQIRVERRDRDNRRW
ncbi:MAG: hypothetical protein KL785_04035 [Brevundimonas sp.]|nr:hypothetical protein [Brevundimonas sp.]